MQIPPDTQEKLGFRQIPPDTLEKPGFRQIPLEQRRLKLTPSRSKEKPRL
jgi:hypothetical protein